MEGFLALEILTEEGARLRLGNLDNDGLQLFFFFFYTSQADPLQWDTQQCAERRDLLLW